MKIIVSILNFLEEFVDICFFGFFGIIIMIGVFFVVCIRDISIVVFVRFFFSFCNEDDFNYE